MTLTNQSLGLAINHLVLHQSECNYLQAGENTAICDCGGVDQIINAIKERMPQGNIGFDNEFEQIGYHSAIDDMHESLGIGGECICSHNLKTGALSIEYPDCPVHGKKEKPINLPHYMKLPKEFYELSIRLNPVRPLTHEEKNKSIEKMKEVFKEQEELNKRDNPQIPEKILTHINPSKGHIANKVNQIIDYLEKKV